MLYDAYQAQQDLFAPLRAGASLLTAAFGDTSMGPAANYMFRSFAAGAEIVPQRVPAISGEPGAWQLKTRDCGQASVGATIP